MAGSYVQSGIILQIDMHVIDTTVLLNHHKDSVYK